MGHWLWLDWEGRDNKIGGKSRRETGKTKVEFLTDVSQGELSDKMGGVGWDAGIMLIMGKDTG